MKPYLVIMAGGSGTRFWPKSTPDRPKQLLSFFPGEDSLLKQTLSRFQDLDPEHRLIVTTERLKAPVEEEVRGLATVLAEPEGRNTAPCVYWAARYIAEKSPNEFNDALMMIMPADHYIPKVKDYLRSIEKAVEWASAHEDLVTVGVKPTRAETGYGYLKLGQSLSGGCRAVERFVEKPNLENAQKFFEDGSYSWNAGMFIWKVSTILAALDEFMPEMKKAWESAGGNVAKAYPGLTATSIDFGVMEKAKNVVCVETDCGWDDLGSWTSLEGLAEKLGALKDAGVVTGGDVVAIESSGNIIDAPEREVALLGVKDLIVVESGGALLIADKSQAQRIKEIVELREKR